MGERARAKREWRAEADHQNQTAEELMREQHEAGVRADVEAAALAGHSCDVPGCDGTLLGHDLAVDFPAETARLNAALDRLREPREDRVLPENLTPDPAPVTGLCTACGAVEVRLVRVTGTRDLSGIGEHAAYPTGYGCEVCA